MKSQSCSSLALTLMAAFVLAADWPQSILAADWPQWRGPQRDGVSHETGLLQEWPKEGPTLLWQIKEVGSGYSTPSVVGEQLFLLSNEGTENESVQARNVQDGSLVWTTRIGKVGNPDQDPRYPGARSTPTVEGEWVFALGSDGDLVGLEKSTGKIHWQRNIRSDFGGEPGRWAYSESPLIDGNAIICTPGGYKATIVALSKTTGDVIWTASVPGADAAGYASAMVADVGGIRQYVQFLGKGVVGVDAKTGKFLWRYDRTGLTPANIPTPVVADNYVFNAGGGGGSALLQLAAKGGGIEVTEKYYSVQLPNAMGGSVKVGEYLYGTGGGSIMCVELATGNVKWKERGVSTASICYADGRLYLHGENGAVALVEAAPEAYREKGNFTPAEVPDRGTSKAWTYPVVANGRLFLRDMGILYCYDAKNKPAEKPPEKPVEKPTEPPKKE